MNCRDDIVVCELWMYLFRIAWLHWKNNFALLIKSVVLLIINHLICCLFTLVVWFRNKQHLIYCHRNKGWWMNGWLPGRNYNKTIDELFNLTLSFENRVRVIKLMTMADALYLLFYEFIWFIHVVNLSLRII